MIKSYLDTSYNKSKLYETQMQVTKIETLTIKVEDLIKE